MAWQEDRKKQDPFLVCLESEDAKLTLLSRAPKLRFHTQYKSTFIAPDMTRFQRVKHKKLVDELRKRRQQGEQNWFNHEKGTKNSANVTATITVPTPDQFGRGISLTEAKLK